MISTAAKRALAGAAAAATVVALSADAHATPLAPSPTAAAAGAAAAATAAAAAAGDVWVPLDLSKHSLQHHLLHSALAGEDQLEEYTLALSPDRQRLRARARLGAKACGHPHIVHGGAISSLLDDALGTLFISSGLTGFTANLNVNFRKPLPAGTTVYVEAAVERVEVSKSGAKKVTLVGRVVDAAAPGVVYTEATALFIAKDIPASAAAAASLRDTVAAAVAPPPSPAAPSASSASSDTGGSVHAAQLS